MAHLIRLIAVALFALLLQFSAGGAASAASARLAIHQCAVSQDQSDIETIAASDLSEINAVTSSEDCQSGKCSGLTCHCTCHGLVGALPMPPLGMLDIPKAVPSRPGHQYFAAITLLPPVPPPQA